MAKIFATLAIIAMLAFVTFAEVEKEDGVLILTDANFDEEIKNHDKILIEFYAPWCGHCKKLTPEYAKAAEKLATLDQPIALAKVDATESKELATRFEIKGFPTLKWFVNQEPQDYQGGRTADEIVNWVKKRSGPPSSEVDDTKLNELKESEKVVVAFFGDADSTEFQEFEKAASSDDKYTYVHNTNADATLPEGLTRPGVAVFRKFDEPSVVFDQAIEKAALADWINSSSVPTLIEFNEEYIEPIFQKQKPAAFLFIDSKNEEHKKLVETYKESAQANKGRIFFSYSGVTEGIQQRLAEFVGVTTENLPRLMIVAFNAQGVDKYVYEGDVSSLTGDEVDKFLSTYEDGTLEKYLKSEDVPESDDAPVKTVVGKNFKEIVGGDKDVLLEFYAPWCGHCKALEPKYTELATELKDIEGLVIAKCDSTANEIDGITISGFPTIKFFPKGSTTAVEYEGEREVEGFKKYLEEHSEAYKAHMETSSKEDL
jgi:protein disulfide-isomerase A1